MNNDAVAFGAFCLLMRVVGLTFAFTSQLVGWERVRPWSGRSEVQISGRSNQIQFRHCCDISKGAVLPAGYLTRRWAPQTHYSLRSNTASTTKDLICLSIYQLFIPQAQNCRKSFNLCRILGWMNSNPILRYYSSLFFPSNLLHLT